ncbi:MAG: hypothetical protein AAF654_10435 [Myxococcota bacterium]
MELRLDAVLRRCGSYLKIPPQPAHQRGDRFAVGAVHPVAAVLLHVDEAGFAEHLEVLGDAGQRQGEVGGELAGGFGLVEAEAQQRAAVRVGEGAHTLGEERL